MNVDWSAINWIAVIVAAIATFMIGGAWYTALFGKAWQKAHGYTDEQCKEMMTRRPPPVYFGTMIVCYIIMAILMAVLIQWTGAASWIAGALIGGVVWVIVAAISVTGHISSPKPWSAYWIDAAYQLVYLIMTGALLGGWQ